MKKIRPMTPGQRGAIRAEYSFLTEKEPEKSLLLPLKKSGGRNKEGRITIRHRGGGEKRLYRKVDFAQEKMGILGKVEALEYDPNRSAFLMLLRYSDGERRYQIAPEGIKVGDEILCDKGVPLSPGNRTSLKNIPLGQQIYNIELTPGRGGKIVRSAGTSAKVLSKEEGWVSVVLPSKEIRKIPQECFATLGQVSNPDHQMEVLGKAGKTRQRGRRPHVRGSAMNPPDHPHGGGEGKTPIGLRYPKTPWSKPAIGVKTRKKHKWSDKYIIKRRK